MNGIQNEFRFFSFVKNNLFNYFFSSVIYTYIVIEHVFYTRRKHGYKKRRQNKFR